MTLVGRVALLVVLNVCWLLCCVPVVTIGASSAALYAVLLDREDHSYLSAVPAFFRELRRCFKTATCLWLPFLLLGLLLTLDLHLLVTHQMMNNALLLTPLLVAAALWGITLLWLHPVLARRPDQSPGAVLRRAFLTGLGELWRSLAALVLHAAPAVLFFLFPHIFWKLAPFWTLLGFALIARLTLALFEPVLNKVQ